MGQHDRKKKAPKTYDYIICGLGTAGSGLARTLSDAGAYVLALEYGHNRDHDPHVQDFETSLDNVYDAQYSIQYSTMPDQGTRGQQTVMRQGSMWGGSSSHNAAIYQRGGPAEWDSFAAVTGKKEWSYRNMVPVYERLEAFKGNTSEPKHRGYDGPMSVLQAQPCEFQVAFEKAASKVLCVPRIKDYNVDIEFGVTSMQNNVAVDTEYSGGFARQSASKVLLTRDVVHASGERAEGSRLTVKSGALVDRVLFQEDDDDDNNDGDGGGDDNSRRTKPRAKSVVYWRKGESHTAHARKRIIVCASALSSAILQRSGVGDRALLESLGIKCVFDNPNVGAHLKNQYCATLYATVNPAVVTQIQQTLDNPLTCAGLALAPNLSTSDTKNSSDGSDGGDCDTCGKKHHHHRHHPHNERMHQRRGWAIFPFAGEMTPYGRTIPSCAFGCKGDIQADVTNMISLYTWNLDPASTGYVRIASRDATVQPNMSQGLYSRTEDMESNMALVRAAFSILKKIARSYPGSDLAPFMPSESVVKSDRLLEAFLRTEVLYADHYVGACRVSKTPDDGVVDGFLRVHGVKGLSVCDTTVFPFGMGNGPMAVALGLGLRYGEILQDMVDR